MQRPKYMKWGEKNIRQSTALSVSDLIEQLINDRRISFQQQQQQQPQQRAKHVRQVPTDWMLYAAGSKLINA